MATVFVGTYTEPLDHVNGRGVGIYIYSFNAGRLRLRVRFGGCRTHPIWLWMPPVTGFMP